MKKTISIVLSMLFIASTSACNMVKPAPTQPDGVIPYVVNVEPVTPAPAIPVTDAPITTAPKTLAPATAVPETEAPATAIPETQAPEVSETPEPAVETEAPIEDTPVPTTEPEEREPISASAKCFYGEYTGTDLTYTGFEPLPLSDFNNPPLQNASGLSTECIDHCTGTPKNGQVHDVVVSIQKGFKKRGADAVCYDDKTAEKVLYLTFDLGVENGYTNMILDTLKEKNVKTTFFCTLPEIKSNSAIITRIIKEGHVVGNHSCTHPDFSSLSRAKMYQEIKGFDDYLRTHYGHSSMYFRYPMGKHSIDSTDLLNSMGYTCVFWSVAWVDYNEPKGADVAYQTVVGKLHPGAIILLHALSRDNAYALASIIDTARSMGYEFRALSDLPN